ncbi:hypothetical protein J6590_028442 [Homalodisca vitripennis]|nr:hypothetical protein J6590_028442 [Homalodisca vitripennis]
MTHGKRAILPSVCSSPSPGHVTSYNTRHGRRNFNSAQELCHGGSARLSTIVCDKEWSVVLSNAGVAVLTVSSDAGPLWRMVPYARIFGHQLSQRAPNVPLNHRFCSQNTVK